MDNNRTKVGRELTQEEDQEMRIGSALLQMEAESEGWRIVKAWFEDMAFHSWVDPREVEDKATWEWRELNAFHAANNARELLEKITKLISRSEYLQKVKAGEIDQRNMRI